MIFFKYFYLAVQSTPSSWDNKTTVNNNNYGHFTANKHYMEIIVNFLMMKLRWLNIIFKDSFLASLVELTKSIIWLFFNSDWWRQGQVWEGEDEDQIEKSEREVPFLEEITKKCQRKRTGRGGAERGWCGPSLCPWNGGHHRTAIKVRYRQWWFMFNNVGK